MKNKYLLILLLCIGSCKQPENKLAVISDSALLSTGYSKSQLWINNLKKQYLLEFDKAQNEAIKKDIKRKYTIELQNYLMDSCQKIIDCGNVYVKKINKEITIGADNLSGQFSDRSCDYIFAASYASDEDLQNFPEYKILNNLKQGSQLSIKLLYSGECTVNEPTNTANQAFTIKAMPYVE